MADGQGLNFGFMNNPMLMDPAMQMAMARQQYAQSLMAQGGEISPVISPWQAAARGIQGALGGYEMNQAYNQMQDYALQSRKAAADVYGNMPIAVPPTPNVAPPAQGISRGGGPVSATQATAPNADLDQILTSAAASNNIPKPLLAAVVQQESSWGKGQPNLGGVLQSTWNDPGYGMAPGAQGQINNPAANIPFAAQYLAARGAAAGVRDWNDPAQAARGLAAYNAGGDPNYAQNVMRYASDLYGPTAQSFATTPGPAAAAPAQPGATTPQMDARSFGVMMAQRYQQAAVQAAQSPYAAARAMAPQLMQQALGYLQFGRFQPVGANTAGQQGYMDTQTGKVEYPGAPPSSEMLSRNDYATIASMSEAARAGTLTPQQQAVYNGAMQRQLAPETRVDPTTNEIIQVNKPLPPNVFIPPGFGGSAVAASGRAGADQGIVGAGAQPVQPHPQVARAQGVPVPNMSEIYGGMTAQQQQEARVANMTRAQATADATNDEATAARNELVQLGRLRTLYSRVPAGTTPADYLQRGVNEIMSNDDQKEFEQITQSMIPEMRMGTGINRVTNKDMGIFERMSPNIHMPIGAGLNVISALENNARMSLEHSRFLHDYADVNGTMVGAETAWQHYLDANPLFDYNPDGSVKTAPAGGFALNPNLRPDNRRQWFQQNTDPNTGALIAPRAGAATAPAARVPSTLTTQSFDHLPPVQPEGTVIQGGGKTYVSRGGQWVQQ